MRLPPRTRWTAVHGLPPMQRLLPKPCPLIVIGGMMIGLVFGDRIFPEIEAIFGDPVTDIAFGMLGGLLAAIAYHLAENIRNAS